MKNKFFVLCFSLCFSLVLSLPSGALIKDELPLLVNAQNKLSKSFVPDSLVKVSGTSYWLDKDCAKAFLHMKEAAKEDGMTLNICSAYRSYATQNYLYQKKIREFIPVYGDDAEEKAAMRVAPPGASEHQTGLAIDINKASASFAKTKEAKWLAENCHEYGFIVRYSEEKTQYTGIIDEPWHIRYVGEEHAAKMVENDWCLEEYITNMNEEAQPNENEEKEKSRRAS